MAGPEETRTLALRALRRLFGDPSGGETESEQRYRYLIETSPAPINLFDADGETVWGNDAVVELLGLDSRADLIGRSIFEFIHPADRTTAERELRTVVEEKVSTGPTYMRLRDADGEVKRIRVSTAPGRYDGRDVGQAVVVDVTPLHELSERYQRERAFIQDAIDALPDVFYVVDAAGRLTRWNDSLVERSGYSDAELDGMAVETFFVESDEERIAESIATAFEEGHDVVEATVRTKHGREVPFEFHKQRLVRDGDVVGLVGIGRDVSGRRARDQHLRAVDRLLQHSLRNKLNVVQGSARLIRDAAGDAPAEQVDRIDDATDRLLSIFEHHRYIVDLLTGREPPERLDLVPTLDSVVEEARSAHPAATITLERPGAAFVRAVPEIDRAFAELVENAVVHSDHGAPTVEVTVEPVDAGVRVEVVDDGPVIPEMDRQVVEGVVPTAPTFHAGGLGLWFVHWAVDRSGGTLAFDVGEPDGNVVTVTLPAPQDG